MNPLAQNNVLKEMRHMLNVNEQRLLRRWFLDVSVSSYLSREEQTNRYAVIRHLLIAGQSFPTVVKFFVSSNQLGLPRGGDRLLIQGFDEAGTKVMGQIPVLAVRFKNAVFHVIDPQTLRLDRIEY